VERPEILPATTEGEIFVAIKDAGAFGPQAYWTYVEDPNVPEDAEGGEKIPSAPEGVERFRLVLPGRWPAKEVRAGEGPCGTMPAS